MPKWEIYSYSSETATLIHRFDGGFIEIEVNRATGQALNPIVALAELEAAIRYLDERVDHGRAMDAEKNADAAEAAWLADQEAARRLDFDRAVVARQDEEREEKYRQAPWPN